MKSGNLLLSKNQVRLLFLSQQDKTKKKKKKMHAVSLDSSRCSLSSFSLYTCFRKDIYRHREHHEKDMGRKDRQKDRKKDVEMVKGRDRRDREISN